MGKRSTLKRIISISARLGSLKIDESCADNIYSKQRVVEASKYYYPAFTSQMSTKILMRFPKIISYLFIPLIQSTKEQVVKNY